MNSNSLSRYSRLLCCAVFFALVSGCAAWLPGKKVLRDDTTPEAALAYYQGIYRLTPSELGRERSILQAVPQTPYTQVRMALLLGHPKAQQDLGKALAILDGLLKSNDPAALPFHPLARALTDNYLERARLDSQLERQGGQLKDSQRKASELQEKLDSLADIERTLTPRPKAGRLDGGKR